MAGRPDVARTPTLEARTPGRRDGSGMRGTPRVSQGYPEGVSQGYHRGIPRGIPEDVSGRTQRVRHEIIQEAWAQDP